MNSPHRRQDVRLAAKNQLIKFNKLALLVA